MTDPVIPGGIRVQYILPGRSGMAEDRYVTTWAFRTEDNLPPSEADLIAASDLVNFFYVAVDPAATASVMGFIGSAANKAITETRAYKLGDAHGAGVTREPLIREYQNGSPSTAASLPSEVALCLSFYAGRNLPRRRGRVYIGPLLTMAAFTDSTTTGIVRPSDSLRTAMTASAKTLQASAVTAGLRWCVLSQSDSNLKDITAGWVDNAFDTQRRRGEDASSRMTWTSQAA